MMSLDSVKKAGKNHASSFQKKKNKKKIKISSLVLQALKLVPYLEGVHSRRESFLCGNDHCTRAR